MSGDEFSAAYRPRPPAGGRRRPVRRSGRRQRAFLLVVGGLVTSALIGVGVGRAVMVRVWEEQSQARHDAEQAGQRPVGWVPGVDRGSHPRSAIPRAESERLVLGRTPAEVWQRFPNGPMPADIDDA
jgi:hypothetical protein